MTQSVGVVDYIVNNPRLLLTLTIFIALTGILHYVLIFWLKIRSITWKYLDYAWYLPAVLAIVLAYAEYIQNNQESALEEAAALLSYQSSTLEEEMLLEFPSCVPRNEKFGDRFLRVPEFGTPERGCPRTFLHVLKLLQADPTLRLNSQHWAYFSKELFLYQASIAETFETMAWKAIDNSGNGHLYSQQVQSISGQISIIVSMNAILQSHKPIRFLAELWPVLLAIAAAIRITKIYGEIRLEKAKSEVFPIASDPREECRFKSDLTQDEMPPSNTKREQVTDDPRPPPH